MSRYFIIETDDGLTIADALNDESLEDAASRHGGVVEADADFYATYEEAMEALAAIPIAEDVD